MPVIFLVFLLVIHSHFYYKNVTVKEVLWCTFTVYVGPRSVVVNQVSILNSLALLYRGPGFDTRKSGYDGQCLAPPKVKKLVPVLCGRTAWHYLE